jgi:hypothetical protein
MTPRWIATLYRVRAELGHWFNPSIAHHYLRSLETISRPRIWLRDLDMTR